MAEEDTPGVRIDPVVVCVQLHSEIAQICGTSAEALSIKGFVDRRRFGIGVRTGLAPHLLVRALDFFLSGELLLARRLRTIFAAADSSLRIFRSAQLRLPRVRARARSLTRILAAAVIAVCLVASVRADSV